jgi:hypothetical protein
MRAASFMKNSAKPEVEGVRFIKRSIFNTLGGYNEYLEAGEDFDLHFRFLDAGYRPGRIAAETCHDVRRYGLVDLLRKNYMYAQTLQRFLDMHEKTYRAYEGPRWSRIARRRRAILSEPHVFAGWIVVTGAMKLQLIYALRVVPHRRNTKR